jgi:hypothetical protein
MVKDQLTCVECGFLETKFDSSTLNVLTYVHILVILGYWSLGPEWSMSFYIFLSLPAVTYIFPFPLCLIKLLTGRLPQYLARKQITFLWCADPKYDAPNHHTYHVLFFHQFSLRSDRSCCLDLSCHSGFPVVPAVRSFRLSDQLITSGHTDVTYSLAHQTNRSTSPIILELLS